MKTQEQIQAIRKESLSYANDGRRITQPGKFEGEPVFAPYYWQLGLEGFSDNDNGTAFFFRFKNSDDDFQIWPELKSWLGRKRSLKIVEDSQGFVHCL